MKNEIGRHGLINHTPFLSHLKNIMIKIKNDLKYLQIIFYLGKPRSKELRRAIYQKKPPSKCVSSVSSIGRIEQEGMEKLRVLLQNIFSDVQQVGQNKMELGYGICAVLRYFFARILYK